MEEASEIIPGLYIGSLASLALLKQLGITHVLSVVNFPLAKDLSRYVALQVVLQDSEGANLLRWLPAVCRFLDAALPNSQQQQQQPDGAVPPTSSHDDADARGSEQGLDQTPQQQHQHQQQHQQQQTPPGSSLAVLSGHEGRGARVLVHCQAGVSRSPAVVVAWLMRSRGMSYFDAVRLVRARRPCADPNEGFVAQLQLFEDMRCSLDLAHPVYRLWALEQVGRQYAEEGYVDPDAFAQLPPAAASAPPGGGAPGQQQQQPQQGQQQTLYRCRKCRQLLAAAEHVVPVDAAMGHKVFRERRRVRREAAVDAVAAGGGDGAAGAGAAAGGAQAALAVPPESCIFVQPMQWMASSVVGAVQGKLHCPACAARLGSFNWSGITNTSGAWVTPAFQLHLSKLDTIEPRPLAAALAGLRRPLVGPHAAGGGAGAGAGAGVPGAVARPVVAAAVAAAAAAEDPQQEADDDDTPVRWQAEEEEEGEQRQQGDRQQQQARVAHVEAASSTSTTAADAGPGAGTPIPVPAPSAGCRSAWFTHLLLDCDGVMVDSEAASCEALRRAILEVTGFDIPHHFPEDFTPVFGMDVRSCVAYYKEALGRSDWPSPEALAPQVQASKEGHYRQLTEGGVRAFGGAEALIRRALDAGLQVGVASSGAPDKIRHNLESSGLAAMVRPEAVASASHCAAGKPAPDVYLACMRATGCTDPARALVVEDAVNGLKAARAAGCYAVAITNSLPAHLLAPWANQVVGHLDELDPAVMTPSAEAQAQAQVEQAPQP